jgi:hypothetical protein
MRRYWSLLYIDVEQKWIDAETGETKQVSTSEEWFGNVSSLASYDA